MSMNESVSELVKIPLSLAEIFSVISTNPLQELSLFLFAETVQRVHSFHALLETLFCSVGLCILPDESSESVIVVVTQSFLDVLEYSASGSGSEAVKMLVEYLVLELSNAVKSLPVSGLVIVLRV